MVTKLFPILSIRQPLVLFFQIHFWKIVWIPEKKFKFQKRTFLFKDFIYLLVSAWNVTCGCCQIINSITIALYSEQYRWRISRNFKENLEWLHTILALNNRFKQIPVKQYWKMCPKSVVYLNCKFHRAFLLWKLQLHSGSQ